MATGRATIIDIGAGFSGEAAANAWLAQAGEPELLAGLGILNRALHGLRLVLADPCLNEIGRDALLVARIGYGAGEQVADGLWSEAREIVPRSARQSRQRVLQPQARLAALLSGREQELVCEELTLRARFDLDRGRDRAAALGLLVALDAALAELPRADAGAALLGRLTELDGQRDAVAEAAQAALSGGLAEPHSKAVAFTLGRIEAALRARAVASA